MKKHCSRDYEPPLAKPMEPWIEKNVREAEFMRVLRAESLKLDRPVEVPAQPTRLTMCRRVMSRILGETVPERTIDRVAHYYGDDVESLLVAFYCIYCGDSPGARACVRNRGRGYGALERCGASLHGVCKSLDLDGANYVDEIHDPIEIVQHQFRFDEDLG